MKRISRVLKRLISEGGLSAFSHAIVCPVQLGDSHCALGRLQTEDCGRVRAQIRR